jgi:hypothetical protein
MTEDPNAGWWQASDGLWYPPETHPERTPGATHAPGPGERPPPPYGTAPQVHGTPGGPSSSGPPTMPYPATPPPYGTPPPPPQSGPARTPPPPPPYGAPPSPPGPPRQHSQYRTPPPQPYGAPPPQPYGAPPPSPYGTPPPADRRTDRPRKQPGPPLPPQPQRGSGCSTALVVLIGVAVVAVVAGTAAIRWISNEIGDQADRLRSGVQCEFLTDEQASQVIDGANAVGLGGITSVAGRALDRRVLRDAPSCLVSGGGRIGRVARQVSEDARSVFDTERAAARQGDYDAGAAGIGDEAFCTDLTGSGAAGVLVRDGNVLVYASISPEAAAPSLGTDSPTSQVAKRSCGTAQQLARAVLTG